MNAVDTNSRPYSEDVTAYPRIGSLGLINPL